MVYGWCTILQYVSVIRKSSERTIQTVTLSKDYQRKPIDICQINPCHAQGGSLLIHTRPRSVLRNPKNSEDISVVTSRALKIFRPCLNISRGTSKSVLNRALIRFMKNNLLLPSKEHWDAFSESWSQEWSQFDSRILGLRVKALYTGNFLSTFYHFTSRRNESMYQALA